MLSGQDDLPQGSWRYAERVSSEPHQVAVVCKAWHALAVPGTRTQRVGLATRTSWLHC